MEMLDLTPEMLLNAYAIGIFPMAEDRDDPELFWIDPRQRGVLPLEQLHIPRRLKKTLRNGGFTVTFDQCFEDVMDNCAAVSVRRDKTWINDQILTLYPALHHMGHAHSVEVWKDGKLAGGLYGISLGGVFFGESMFTIVTDASKVALVHLVVRLINAGYSLLDTQFITDHLKIFGAIEIPRNKYRIKLAQAIEDDADFYRNMHEDEVPKYLSNLSQHLQA